MRLFLLLLACGAPWLAGWAQVVLPEPPDTNDFQSWTSLKADWKPTPAWSLELEQQIRIREDLGSFDRQFQQLSVGWSPQWGAVAETQQIVLGTRLLHRLDDSGNKQGWEQYFRWHLDHVTKVKLGRWSLASRIRYQRRSALRLAGGDDPASEAVKTAWRLKAVVSHNIKKWKLDPRASLERFIAPVPEGWPSDGAWRARFGTDFKPGKRQRLKVVLQREWRGKYLPSGTGATLDDFRLYGSDEWALVVGWRYRFKS